MIFRYLVIGETSLIAFVLMPSLFSLISMFPLVPHLNQMSWEMNPNFSFLRQFGYFRG